MSSYKLRPHHGLCIGFFEGRGYTPEFAAHMASVVRALDGSSPVVLTRGADIICAACPNHTGPNCVYDEKVMRYDAAVLRLCRLEYGDTLRWGAFRDLVRTNIIEENRLRQVCGDCRWAAVCQEKADRPFSIAKRREPL